MSGFVWLVLGVVIGYAIHWLISLSERMRMKDLKINSRRIMDEAMAASNKFQEITSRNEKLQQKKDDAYFKLAEVCEQLINQGLDIESENAELKTKMTTLRETLDNIKKIKYN